MLNMKTKKILSVILSLGALSLCFGCGANKDKTSSKGNTSDVVTIIAAENGPAEEASNADPVEHSKDLAQNTETPDNSQEEENPEGPEATLAPPASDEDLESQVQSRLEKMSLEDKVAQMFVVTPESVTDSDIVVMAGEQTKEAIDNIPIGGFVYMSQNLQDPSQVKEMLSNAQQFSIDRIELPLFTCLDEEGGTVTRVNGNPNFNLESIESMADVETEERARSIGREMGRYLSELGFNVDFAPVADVLTNPDNEVVRYRSFGSDPEQVADMCSAVLQGLREYDVLGTFKHFPGHGATQGDSHTGNVFISKTWDELKGCELIPFQRGVEENVDFIMVGHISVPNVIGDDTPASLSYKMIYDCLKSEMQYKGLVITDAMNMGAIEQLCSSGKAAVKTIQSGTDIVLMPSDFESAYQAVINAVHNSSLSEDRINDAVTKILRTKLRLLQNMQNEPASLE